MPRCGLWLFGQSNAMRQLAGYPTAWDTPSPVIQARRTATSVAAFEASGWDVDAIGDLRPRSNGLGGFVGGIEQSLGRTVATWMGASNLVLIVTAVSGTNFGIRWDPGGGWPTLENNLWTQSIDYVQSVLTTYGARLGAMFQVAGEGDANAATSALSLAYYSNMLDAHERVRRQCGNVVYGYNRLISPGIWEPEFRDNVQAAQKLFHDPGSGRFMIDTDDLATADGQHYNIDSLDTIGQRLAAVLLSPLWYGRGDWLQQF